MYSEVRTDRFERLIALRRKYPSAQSGVVNMRGEQLIDSPDRLSAERFEHEVVMLKDDIRQSGLSTLLKWIAITLALTVLLGAVLHKAFFAASLFILLGGSSMYFTRKQKNYELITEIDRELLGRE